jgi:chitinase
MIGKYVSRLAMIALMLALLLGVSFASAARDRIPPTAPTLSVTAIGASHVSLSWTASTDNQPYIWYWVYLNGNQYLSSGANRSINITGLTPSTTYVFTVRARDNGINWSQPSNAVTVTTPPANSSDTTPPTTPTNFTGFDAGCGEAWVRWTQSTDNVDPQVAIRYEFYINNVFRPESTVHGYDRTVVYALAEGTSTIQIFAIDSAGNRSAPASLTIRLSPPCQSKIGDDI